MSFEGKHVLVTGGSGGIGSKTAQIFAERGAAELRNIQILKLKIMINRERY